MAASIAGGTLRWPPAGGLTLTGTAIAGRHRHRHRRWPLACCCRADDHGRGPTSTCVTPAGATLTAGKITAGNAVRLTAGQGVMAQSFQIDPATILLQTGGAMSLTDSFAGVERQHPPARGHHHAAPQQLHDRHAGRGCGRQLVLDGGLFTIGRAVGFSAPGGIQTLGRITVVPGGGLLPAVVFDTRAAGPRPIR